MVEPTPKKPTCHLAQDKIQVSGNICTGLASQAPRVSCLSFTIGPRWDTAQELSMGAVGKSEGRLDSRNVISVPGAGGEEKRRQVLKAESPFFMQWMRR